MTHLITLVTCSRSSSDSFLQSFLDFEMAMLAMWNRTSCGISWRSMCKMVGHASALYLNSDSQESAWRCASPGGPFSACTAAIKVAAMLIFRTCTEGVHYACGSRSQALIMRGPERECVLRDNNQLLICRI